MQPTNGFHPLGVRTHEEMKDVLMDPHAGGPDVHYYMIRGGSTKRNITVWESGTVGGEYIKAYGHYHVDAIGETYTVLAGSGILLKQERARDTAGAYINDELIAISATFLKAGESIYIDPGIGHAMINTGDTWLATSDDSPVATTASEAASWPVHADYDAVKVVHGFGYYAIQEGGTCVFKKNPNYKVLPALEIIGL